MKYLMPLCLAIRWFAFWTTVVPHQDADSGWRDRCQNKCQLVLFCYHNIC